MAVLPSVDQHARETIRSLFAFIQAQGDTDYIGESISQLEHSLQAADLAQKAGADKETVLAALLHDIGRFIPDADTMPEMIAPDGTYVGRASHEVLGENFLRQLGFSEKVCRLVGAHVIAKRYLCAVDATYYEGLSPSSKATLKFQGNIFDKEQVKAAQKDPLLEEKLAVRRWDDQAKVPGAKCPELDSYATLATSCLLNARSSVTLHSRTYNLPQRPTVIVCVDGFDPTYLQRGLEAGILPTFDSFLKNGFHTTAEVAMPSFTNPNNVSIITGAPPAIHGIAGNFFLDPKTREETMIKDDTLLRGSTILEQMSKRGLRVAAITAKDKLRRILAHGLNKSICFSAEYANVCTEAENGIADVEAWLGRPAPPQYSGDLSLFVLDAGIKLLREDRADLFYLTLSDYIQHKYAPGSKESDEFMMALDARLKQLVNLGAVVAVTGDHGMSGKSTADGAPNVLFLQDELEARFGKGCARVICPITDPFVRHHGALGSFVRVYIDCATNAGNLNIMIDHCKSFSQVELALPGPEAAARFEMPLDREGDIVVVATSDAVIGSTRAEHNLENLRGHRLRSHGGLSEKDVPLMMSKPVQDPARAKDKKWRNFDAFDLALNW